MLWRIWKEVVSWGFYGSLLEVNFWGKAWYDVMDAGEPCIAGKHKAVL